MAEPASNAPGEHDGDHLLCISLGQDSHHVSPHTFISRGINHQLGISSHFEAGDAPGKSTACQEIGQLVNMDGQ